MSAKARLAPKPIRSVTTASRRGRRRDEGTLRKDNSQFWILNSRLPTLDIRRHSMPERFGAAVREDSHQLFLEEVRLRAHVGRDALVVHLPAPVDVLAQALVEVAALPALEHRALVVELDLGDEQPREAARLLVALVGAA